MWLSPCNDVIGCRVQRSDWKKSMRISTSIANSSTFPVNITLHSIEKSTILLTHFCIYVRVDLDKTESGRVSKFNLDGMLGMSSRSRSRPVNIVIDFVVVSLVWTQFVASFFFVSFFSCSLSLVLCVMSLISDQRNMFFSSLPFLRCLLIDERNVLTVFEWKILRKGN